MTIKSHLIFFRLITRSGALCNSHIIIYLLAHRSVRLLTKVLFVDYLCRMLCAKYHQWRTSTSWKEMLSVTFAFTPQKKLKPLATLERSYRKSTAGSLRFSQVWICISLFQGRIICAQPICTSSPLQLRRGCG